MRLQLPSLDPNSTYNVQVRAQENGAVSEWSQLYTIVISSDVLAPTAPSALSWTVQGSAFVATWTAPTTNTDASLLKDLKDYQVTVFSPANPSQTAIYYTTATRFDLTYDVNQSSFTTPRAQVTVEVRARDTAGNMSAPVTATATNPAPAPVTGLVVTGGTGSISSKWDNNGDADIRYYEIYGSQTIGFTPGPTNLIAQTSSNSFTFTANASETWYVKVRAVDVFGSGSATYASGNATAKAITDGNPPSASPVPTVISATAGLYVRWTPPANNDPLLYEVHVSPTTGFTPGPTTLIGETAATFVTVRALPGPIPAPGDVDARKLQYDTDYFVRIIAKDDDGAAAASTEAVGQVVRVEGPDLAADSVTANNVVAGSFTGEEFAGTVFIGNTFKTAETGQRAEFGIDGYRAYKSDGSLKFEVTTDDQDTFVDGEFIARGLTITGGASFQSNQNEITADSALTLMRGIVPPTAIPQLNVTYDTLRPDTTTTKTGTLGTFALAPAEVQCAVYHLGKINLYQFRNNGTRVWRFDVVTGAYDSHYDMGNIQVTGEVWHSSSGDGIMMVRYVPNNSWYIFHSGNYMPYTRLGTGTPSVIYDGTNWGITENVGNRINIGYRTAVPTVHGTPIPAASSTVLTSTSLSYSSQIFTVLKDTFDGGASRYITSDIGQNFNGRAFNTSGTWLDEDWPSPAINKRGIAYDGTNIWQYGADGYLYKHTSAMWPSTTSSIMHSKMTFYDDFGTTHETLPGTASSITMRKRAKLIFTPPPIPDNGGVDDPKKVRLYMGIGATFPGNAALFKQLETAVQTTVPLPLLTAGITANLAPGNFPLTNPAKIKNDDSSLVISGDGSVKATSLNLGLGSTIGDIYFGTITATTTSAGVITIPHPLGVAPTAVFASIQNSQYSASPTAPTSTAVDVFCRNMTVAGAPVLNAVSVTCRYIFIV